MAGCYCLAWGVESGSDRVLKLMNKGFFISQAGMILRDSYFTGIINIVNIMTGFANETKEDINHTIAFIKENAVYIHRIRMFDFELVPYSPIYRYPTRFGIKNLFIEYDSTIGFGRIGFDEIGGLKWKDKFKQKHRAFKKVQHEVHRIFSRKVHDNKRR